MEQDVSRRTISRRCFFIWRDNLSALGSAKRMAGGLRNDYPLQWVMHNYRLVRDRSAVQVFVDGVAKVTVDANQRNELRNYMVSDRPHTRRGQPQGPRTLHNQHHGIYHQPVEFVRRHAGSVEGLQEGVAGPDRTALSPYPKGKVIYAYATGLRDPAISSTTPAAQSTPPIAGDSFSVWWVVMPIGCISEFDVAGMAGGNRHNERENPQQQYNNSDSS